MALGFGCGCELWRALHTTSYDVVPGSERRRHPATEELRMDYGVSGKVPDALALLFLAPRLHHAERT